jgi:glycosyltransferase involved in cell wall biosynthesis
MMITTIIPCYNAAPFLAEAIESVLAQSRASDEVIVVDDCSTDDSAEIAARYPVRLLCTERNSGHAAARNVALAAAEGDLIAWLDADDYWDAHHLAKVCGLLDAHPTAGVAFSGVRLIGARQGEWTNFPCHDRPTDVFWDCFRRTILSTSTVVTRKAAVDAVGGFNAAMNVAPDFDFWLRMSRHTPFVSTPEITGVYRWHAGQISRDRARQFQSLYESRDRFIAELAESGETELAGEAAARLPDIWDADLRWAWKRGRMDVLRALLALSPLVPGGEYIERRWRMRSRMPGFVIRNFYRGARTVRSALRGFRDVGETAGLQP